MKENKTGKTPAKVAVLENKMTAINEALSILADINEIKEIKLWAENMLNEADEVLANNKSVNDTVYAYVGRAKEIAQKTLQEIDEQYGNLTDVQTSSGPYAATVACLMEIRDALEAGIEKQSNK